jgi:phosphate transport system substrate-binding protein
LEKLRSLALCALIACGAGIVTTATAENLNVRGSTTTYIAAKRMAEKFQQRRSGVQVVVGGGGSEQGIAALIRGETDIANSSRFIDTAELKWAIQQDIYPVPFRIADDCIIPIVHNSNRVRNLSMEQLRAIYAGRIDNWSEVGGVDQPIQVISREMTSGTSAVWRDLVMGGEDIVTLQPLQRSSGDMVRTVSSSPGAIGYIGLGNLSARIKPLRVDGVMGSIRSVRDGSYPISRPLFMFTQGWPAGLTLEFINFVLDPEGGQPIIEEMGFVPLHNSK